MTNTNVRIGSESAERAKGEESLMATEKKTLVTANRGQDRGEGQYKAGIVGSNVLDDGQSCGTNTRIDTTAQKNFA